MPPRAPRQAAFRVHTMGLLVLLTIAVGFAAGEIRGELVLTLISAVFSAIWAYCLLAVLFLSLVHGKRARRLRAATWAKEIAVGESVEVRFVCDDAGRKGGGAFFRAPGILLRCTLDLRTLDGRRLRCEADPGLGPETLCVPERGAWYSPYDECAFADALGFFRFFFRLPAPEEARLLSVPRPSEEPLPVNPRYGGSERRSLLTFERTDNLIEHRPYVPGDDPRRINWKLYSHGGELFVREGEREPPPHSRLLILIDTECDPGLFDAPSGRRHVDLLCENALAAANACADSALHVLIGHSGGRIRDEAERAASLALPAALPLFTPGADLPEAPDERGCLIMALPRIFSGGAGGSALDRFLGRRRPAQSVDLLFLYERAELEEHGRTCASFYGGKAGVRAFSFFCGAASSPGSA
jgi:uncharacterized protein (DUF58 family)